MIGTSVRSSVACEVIDRRNGSGIGIPSLRDAAFYSKRSHDFPGGGRMIRDEVDVAVIRATVGEDQLKVSVICSKVEVRWSGDSGERLRGSDSPEHLAGACLMGAGSCQRSLAPKLIGDCAYFGVARGTVRQRGRPVRLDLAKNEGSSLHKGPDLPGCAEGHLISIGKDKEPIAHAAWQFDATILDACAIDDDLVTANIVVVPWGRRRAHAPCCDLEGVSSPRS